MDNEEQRRIPPKPAALPTGGLPQAAAPAPATEDPPPTPRPARTALLKALFVVVLLAVVGGLIWLVNWLGTGTPNAPGDPGSGAVEISPTALATPRALPLEGVAPPDYRLGDCFKDFDPSALRSTVVACDTPHSAQLVAAFRYPGNDAYPGREALAAKALEACQAAKLAPAANDYALNFQRSYPSGSSWESGDRRADCYVMADGGNVINASALP